MVHAGEIVDVGNPCELDLIIYNYIWEKCLILSFILLFDENCEINSFILNFKNLVGKSIIKVFVLGVRLYFILSTKKMGKIVPIIKLKSKLYPFFE